ncbi:uncharacterized protein P884DRAFT_248360 [Thermothelomyces heterothallicus CBS 202.75]|uniref:uncharacterized protein n=1 Tax=Thermothelomyces heterothallicus CBS 202.75 TaxID=1149848 RepID=UPI00374489CD
MWRINLRSQPSRPSPPFDPIVEAWLDSLPPPTAKPSSEELKQWRLADYHGLGWSVFVICIVLRAASLAISLPVTGVIASVIAGRRGPFSAIERLLPVVIVCPVVTLWNAAELVSVRVRRDGGFSPNVHVVIDGVLFLGVATATGSLLVDVICGFTDFEATFDTAAEEISSICLLVVMMVIHSFLLFFFICNYVEESRRRSGVAHSQGMPRYTSNPSPWPTAGYTASDTGPPATPRASKCAFDTTALESREPCAKPPDETAEFAVSPEPRPSATLPPAAALETAALAQAMSGLWGNYGGGIACSGKVAA